ncbi:MAG: cytochrome-c oxidase, cbb3-type subunit I [Candidatus Eisenbacteria bacterium]|nr:cytochrome-c oxidase, cbb3-type subunit I [Candidatus Eisenbacteria bacterium]
MATADTGRTVRVEYNDSVVRAFLIATLVWGVVGLSLGVLVATQLSFWQANFGIEWLTFGRLRPLHTNAAIFAFVGNSMFAGIYHSSQRLLKTRLGSDGLSWIHFWGWQIIIVCAALTIPLGFTQSKEYAELIWPIDLMVALIWVVFAVNFFMTVAKRNEPNLYVALWFYIATIVTIPVLYIVNNLQLPTGALHSYSIFGGVQDALVQWWYGHNAVGFFLTTPILGLMYYYLPKAAGRPVYSYRLSIVHFWALIFVYIWAGPHHLLYTALPDWAQSLGMVFSLMLWAPSWGGMLNGLLTLRGAWDKLRTDPVIKFFIAAVTFYGMSTFEGPLLSIKTVSSLGHYTDWIIGHVHGGTLGWNGFMAAGVSYWLIPRLWNTKLYNEKWADAHFWIGLFGILLYVGSMWISGVNMGLYWRALDADGFLQYPDFVEGLISAGVLWKMRLVGGSFYLVGFLLMVANLTLTMQKGKFQSTVVEVPAMPKLQTVSSWALIKGKPVVFSLGVIVAAALFAVSSPVTFALPITFGAVLTVAAILYAGAEKREGGSWHQLLEGKPLAFTILSLVAILIGGIAELVPTIVIDKKAPAVAMADSTGVVPAADVQVVESRFLQQPYSPLELEGRDVYISEGCYNCHSQMIRPFRHETLRYGEYSRASEFRYDHPFQWGSKRTGPDLHRVGGKYPNLWHYQHLMDPRSTSQGSNMPVYAWLKTRKVDFTKTRGKMIAMRKLGVPYTDEDIADCQDVAKSQGTLIASDLQANAVTIEPDCKMVAVIAYLQRLGRGPQPVALEQAAAPEATPATPETPEIPAEPAAPVDVPADGEADGATQNGAGDLGQLVGGR